MATKLRNFSTNAITKFAAFILVVIIITSTVVGVQYISYAGMEIEPLFYEEYKNSDSFLYEVRYAYESALSLIEHDDSGIQHDINYYYYISDGTDVYSNAPVKEKSYFEQFDDAFYAYENREWTFGKNTSISAKPRNYSDKYTIYVAYPHEFMEKKQTEWKENRDKIVPLAIAFLINSIVTLMLVIYLIIVTGRKPQQKEIYFSPVDSIYTDVLLASLIPIGVIWFRVIWDYLYVGTVNDRLGSEQIFSMTMIGLITAVVTSLCGIILLSLSRQFKAGKFIKHSFCYLIYDFFKSLFDGRIYKNYPLTKSLFYRQLTFIIASGILVLFTFIFFFAGSILVVVPPLMEIIIIFWYVKGNNKTFDDINEGFNESLEEKMKSERMKIELVTNVSHDLKTPLTSIISYADLLSKEDLSETARDYVNILIDKSNRLKQIVSDLFDLAKSNSGDISTDLEKLDLKKLIEQTLGDMEDKIEESQLQMKVSLPEEPVIIIADGKKLYRVFQNIIDNALKYSLRGTRVFIELEKYNNNAVATIKNTAGYEMNFTDEEIIQRFTRGDKSRTTEGSGLGLSIAESFTNVCGGLFKVEIDGDLFKVSVSFKIEN